MGEEWGAAFTSTAQASQPPQQGQQAYQHQIPQLHLDAAGNLTRPDGSSEHHAHEHDGGDADGGGDAAGGAEESKRKKKRPRQVLSCSIRQPFALNDELIALRNRVSALEDIIATLLGASAANSHAHNTPASNGTYSNGVSISTMPQHPATTNGLSGAAGGRGIATVGDKGDTEEESVAAVLQRLREGSPTNGAGTDGDTPMSSIGSTLNGGSDHRTLFSSINGHSGIPAAPSELDSLLTLIPNRQVAELLLESFLARVDWNLHVLHIPTLKEDFKTFFDYHNAGKGDSPSSAAWIIPRLSTFFMIFALGLYFLPASASPYSAQESHPLPARWVEAADKALNVADWSGKPSIRSVQTILLMSYYWHNTGNIDKLGVFITAGVRIAQSLGLHTSDQTPVSFPNDSFRPSGDELAFFCKELGNRVWWYLCVFDWDVSFRCRNISVTKPQDFNTSVPLNLTDEDLLSGPQPSRALTQPTQITFMILYTGIVFMQQQWAGPKQIALANDGLNAETVRSIDALVRDGQSRFPDYLLYEKAAEKSTRGIDTSKPYIPLQRLNLSKEVHSRLCRLHRHRIFDDSQSRNLARKSAGMLLTVAQDFRSRTDFSAKLWWIPAYTVLASSIILISNIYMASLASPPTPDDADLRRRDVIAGLAALRTSTPKSAHTEQGIRIIELLLAEEVSIRAAGTKEFDLARYQSALNTISRNTMCCAQQETAELKKVAEALSVPKPATSAVFAVATSTSTSALDPVLAMSTFPAPTTSIGGEPFAISATSYASTASASKELEEFYRTLGFLPPPGSGFGGSGAAAPTGDLPIGGDLSSLFDGNW
ncbi:hypothetical protein MNV49_005987 [Pseudohyphozyma bogoriensis]|nr:hypothetical protein MNV49_005987 [Pseudohyphozyma bogoriensis]